MLAERRILAGEDRDSLLSGLEQAQLQFEQDRFPFVPEDEDIDMAIERRLALCLELEQVLFQTSWLELKIF